MTAFHEGKRGGARHRRRLQSPRSARRWRRGTADGTRRGRAPRSSLSRAGAALDPHVAGRHARDGTALPLASCRSPDRNARLEATGLKRGKYTFSIKAARYARRRDATRRSPRRGSSRARGTRATPSSTRSCSTASAATRARSPRRRRPSERAGGTLAGLRARDRGRRNRGARRRTRSGSRRSTRTPTATSPAATAAPTRATTATGRSRRAGVDARVASEAERRRLHGAPRTRAASACSSTSCRTTCTSSTRTGAKQHATDWFNEGPACLCGQGACDWATHIQTCWFAPYLPDLDWTNPEAARAATDDVMWWFDRWGAALGVPVEDEPRLVELDYGEWDERSFSEFPPDDLVRWRTDASFAPPGGESLLAVGARVASLCERARSTAIPSSRSATSRRSRPPRSGRWTAIRCSRGGCTSTSRSITRVGTPPGRPCLLGFNDTAHLP